MTATELQKRFPLRIKTDFGIKSLLPEWKAMLKPEGLREDFVAGLTVACVALPLSLAIALGSEVEPAVGVLAAILGGLICALLGGTPLAVSGPAAAMAVLVAAIVEEHGMSGLVLVTFGAGLCQILIGVLGLGRIARFVPGTVVHGFTAGVGAIILVGQLPRALGLPPPDQSHIVNVVLHITELFEHTNILSLVIAVSALALTLGLPKIHPRIPAALLAVFVPTLGVSLFDFEVAQLGEIPTDLPRPRLPDFPPREKFGAMFWDTAVVCAIASLETLLSSSAIDRIARRQRHSPDQEMIGQGFANSIVGLFGGIPVTGVIVRSALNVQAGARTRRSALLHSVFLIIMVLILAPIMKLIPMAALAGVLLAVAVRMLDPRPLLSLWHVSKRDALVFLITFGSMVFVDLLVGVQAGIMAAALVAAIRLGRGEADVFEFNGEALTKVSFYGALTFFSTDQIERVGERLDKVDPNHGVLFDMSGVTSADSSAVELILDLAERVKARGGEFAVFGLSPTLQALFVGSDHRALLQGRIAVTLTEADRLLAAANVARGRILAGVERFQRTVHERYEPLLQQFRVGQTPHTFMITCADSRIVPHMMTGVDPGELFVLRTMGNIIPSHAGEAATEAMAAEAAAIEYASGVLKVTEIIVCGHARCGAIAAVARREVPPELNRIQKWLELVTPRFKSFIAGHSDDDISKQNVLGQIEALKTFPSVRTRIEDGSLTLRAWFFAVDTGQILEFDAESNSFQPVVREATGFPSTPPPAERGMTA